MATAGGELWGCASATAFAFLLSWLVWRRTAGHHRRDLQRAQHRFRAVYAASPAGMVETDVEQRIVHCNPALGKMLGLPSDAVVGHFVWEFFHADSAPPDPTAAADLAAGRRSTYSGQRLLQQADGSPLPVQLDWAAIPVDDGGVAELVCVIADVSSLAAAHGELARARERAEVLWQQAPIGVVEGTLDGVITTVNDAFAAMLGYRPEELVGTRAADLADPAARTQIQASVDGLRTGQGYSAERHYVARDGTLVPVHVSTAVMHDGLGDVARLAGFVVNMTAAQAQRTALEAAMEQVASAHAELVQRQRFTDAVLETVDVGIESCDSDGSGLVRNRAGRLIEGAPDDSAGAGPRRPTAPLELRDGEGNRLPPERYPLARALRGEVVQDEECTVGPLDGAQRDVVVRGGQLTDDDGTVVGAVAAITDVTAERAAARELTQERSRLTNAQRLGQLGSFTFDLRTRTFTFSEEIYRIWGLAPGADLAALRQSMIHPDDLPRVMAEWDAAIVRGGQSEAYYRIHRPDGSLRFLRVILDVTLDERGAASSIQGTHLDVTDLTTAQREAIEANSFFQAMLTAMPDYTFVTDVRTGAVLYGSPGRVILGITSGQLRALGSEVTAALIHPEDQLRLQEANVASRDLADGDVLQIRYRALHADKSWRWLSRRVTPFRRDDKTGQVVEVLGVVRDITEAVEGEDRLNFSALHDPLTGLPNRALLMDRLGEALARSSQTGLEVAVLFCDLDGFKRINDTAGHAAGDAVLVETASRLKSALREHDTIARVGGDEFVMVVEPWKRADSPEEPTDGDDANGSPGDRARAVRLAERIGAALQQPITVDGVDHRVTASVGITYAGCTTSDTPDEVLQSADAAMYAAKHRGKDRFEVFDHGVRAQLSERDRVEQVLRRALSGPVPTGTRVPSPRGDAAPVLTPAFQPVFESGSGALVGFEALARLSDNDGLTLPTDVVIDVAEHTALIRPLGVFMLAAACAQLAAWRRQVSSMRHVTMAVNISALQAQHSSLADDVHRALADEGLTGADLVLELTETALLNAADSTISALRQLRSEGVGIAIDDFGIGYGGLHYLATLPVSALKVDRSFTAGLASDPTARKIVYAVIGLAADLDLQCVIEGVESQAQRAALPPGVQLQGFLTGRPSAAPDLNIRRLAATRSLIRRPGA
ncbi:MAG TPA: EAL domain-containing protein [Frankiaceae bacterium]|nr:EAL domain-containing protein [Frankiaceae bacterium]